MNQSETENLLKTSMAAHLLTIESQFYRIQQTQARIRELDKQADNDTTKQKRGRLNQEVALLQHNLALLKSKARTEGLKIVLQELEQIRRTEGGAFLEALTHFKSQLASVYILQSEPLPTELETLDLLLDLIWFHLDSMIHQTFDTWDLEAETEQMNRFKQSKFHPLEKMALLKIHAQLLQIVMLQRRQSLVLEQEQVVKASLELKSPTDQPVLNEPIAPEQSQQELNRLQRHLFQLRGRLQNRQLTEAERQNFIDQIWQLQAEQSQQYSLLRQYLIWFCVNKLIEYHQRFEDLDGNWKNSSDFNQTLNITQQGQYVKQCLAQDLYKLFLDCQQTNLQNQELKSLDFIQNQQDKVSHLGLDNYSFLFQTYLQQDQLVLTELQAQSDYIQESRYLHAMTEPLHKSLAQIENLESVLHA